MKIKGIRMRYNRPSLENAKLQFTIGFEIDVRKLAEAIYDKRNRRESAMDAAFKIASNLPDYINQVEIKNKAGTLP